jgi:hypothetical protein
MEVTMVEGLIELCPFDKQMEGEIKNEEPVSFKPILAKYYKYSILQTRCSVFPYIVKGEQWGVKNCWYRAHLTLLEIYNIIIGPNYKPETDQLRSITDPKAAKIFKSKNFDYATFSGTFSYRSDDKLIIHSKLICIDLDHLGSDLQRVRSIVNSDPLTIMSFISPSGDGLKVIFCIEPEKYSQEFYYRAISKYLSNKCGLSQEIEPSCKDVSRACFLLCDPSAYLNLNFCRI